METETVGDQCRADHQEKSERQPDDGRIAGSKPETDQGPCKEHEYQDQRARCMNRPKKNLNGI